MASFIWLFTSVQTARQQNYLWSVQHNFRFIHSLFCSFISFWLFWFYLYILYCHLCITKSLWNNTSVYIFFSSSPFDGLHSMNCIAVQLSLFDKQIHEWWNMLSNIFYFINMLLCRSIPPVIVVITIVRKYTILSIIHV